MAFKLHFLGRDKAEGLFLLFDSSLPYGLGGNIMVKATLDRLQDRMNKQIEYSVKKHVNRNIVYTVLKKQQISYKYLQLMQTLMRKD